MPPENSCGWSSARDASGPGSRPDRAARPPADEACSSSRPVVRHAALDDLAADRVHRVERRQRILEDHRDLVAPGSGQFAGRPSRGSGSRRAVDFAAVIRDAWEQAHDGHRGDRLAGSRLADDPEQHALLHRVADPAHGSHHSGACGKLTVRSRTSSSGASSLGFPDVGSTASRTVADQVDARISVTSTSPGRGTSTTGASSPPGCRSRAARPATSPAAGCRDRGTTGSTVDGTTTPERRVMIGDDATFGMMCLRMMWRCRHPWLGPP